jgi:hypothetical protein
VAVGRDDFLCWATNALRLYVRRKAVLDFVFVGESGTGMGVMHDFYSSTTDENERVGLWNVGFDDSGTAGGGSGDRSEYLNPPGGLFPAVIPQTEASVAAAVAAVAAGAGPGRGSGGSSGQHRKASNSAGSSLPLPWERS